MKTETKRSTGLREEIEALRHMTAGQLKEKYRDVFGEGSRSNHKQFLFRRIAWRIQANAEGGLSERARRRALEIANDEDRVGTRTARVFDQLKYLSNACIVFDEFDEMVIRRDHKSGHHSAFDL